MDKENTYAKDVARLKQLVAEIERDDLDVDNLADKVKEATILIKRCKEKLYIIDEEVQKALAELE